MCKSVKSCIETLVKWDVLDLFKLIRCIFVSKSVTVNALRREDYGVCAPRPNTTRTYKVIFYRLNGQLHAKM